MELRKKFRRGCAWSGSKRRKNGWKMDEKVDEKILLEIYVSKERKSEWKKLSKEEWMKCKRQRKK